MTREDDDCRCPCCGEPCPECEDKCERQGHGFHVDDSNVREVEGRHGKERAVFDD